MLKPMKSQSTQSRNIFLWVLAGLLLVSGVVALVSAFSGDGGGEEEVNAVYTNAAATVAAQQLTMQAAAPSATATAAVTPTSIATVTPLASPTLFTSGVLPTSASPAAVSGAVGCNNSVYVADVTIPDDTVVTPGQTFTKTWKLQNTGSCPWTTTFKVSFVSGNAMGGVTTPLTTTVAPGTSGDISVAMTAPATTGEAIGYWILTNDSGQNFGTTFYIKVKVGASGTAVTGTAVTGTPGTATATSTGSVAVPVAANNPVITLACTPNGAQFEYTGQLTWEDKSTNEQGFNIYVNGVLADIAPANSTSYNVAVNPRITNVIYDANTPINYSVEAFNAGGKATQATVVGKCP